MIAKELYYIDPIYDSYTLEIGQTFSLLSFRDDKWLAVDFTDPKFTLLNFEYEDPTTKQLIDSGLKPLDPIDSTFLARSGRWLVRYAYGNDSIHMSKLFTIHFKESSTTPKPTTPPKLKDFNFISQDIRENSSASYIDGITRHAQWIGVQVAPQWEGWSFDSLEKLPTIKRFEAVETSSSTAGSTPAIEMDYGLLTFRFKVDSLSPVNNSAALMVTLETSDGVAIQKPLMLNFL